MGEISSLLFEPLIGVWSDRGSKRLPVLLGTVLLAAGFGLFAAAPGPGWLMFAIAVIWPATGMAIGLAQATLVDSDPAEAARTMTRVTISAGIGDLAAPAVAASVLAAGLGWRPLFWLAAALWTIQAVLLQGRRFPDPHRDAERPHPWHRSWSTLRSAVQDRTVLRWMAVVALATLLDEVFLGFAGIYLAEVVGLAPGATGLAIGAGVAGAMAGLLVTDRLVPRMDPAAILRPASLLALAGLGTLLLARSGPAAAAALFVTGLGASAWYPVASGEIYRLLPGRSGAVHALSVLLVTPVSLTVPPLVGLVANGHGILAGMAVLAAAPLLAMAVLPPRLRLGPTPPP